MPPTPRSTGRSASPRASGALIGKGNYRHFMLKEIFEQPAVIGDTLNALINPATRTVHLPELPFALGELERMTLIACGTAYHACIVAKYWLERIARISVEIDIASEFRYRAPGDAARRRGDLRLAIGRDRRHPGGAALRQVAGAEDHRCRQPAGKLDRARGRHRPADPGRARDRRRLDQGVHDPARRPRLLHGGVGAGARRDRPRPRGGARRGDDRDPVARQRGPEP